MCSYLPERTTCQCEALWKSSLDIFLLFEWCPQMSTICWLDFQVSKPFINVWQDPVAIKARIQNWLQGDQSGTVCVLRECGLCQSLIFGTSLFREAASGWIWNFFGHSMNWTEKWFAKSDFCAFSLLNRNFQRTWIFVRGVGLNPGSAPNVDSVMNGIDTANRESIRYIDKQVVQYCL